MRVVTNTPEMLIVEDRPIFWSAMMAVWVLLGVGVCISGLLALDLIRIFWGGAFGALALVLFLLVLRRVRIYFDRRLDLVELRARSIRGATRQRFALQDLRDARVQVSGGDTDTYRVALHFDGPDGIVPTRQAYDSSRSSQRAADAINAWLAG